MMKEKNGRKVLLAGFLTVMMLASTLMVVVPGYLNGKATAEVASAAFALPEAVAWGAAVTDGYGNIYVVSGENGDSILTSAVQKLTPSTGGVSVSYSMRPMKNHCAGYFGGKIFTFGGYALGQSLTAIYEYDISSESCTRVADFPMPIEGAVSYYDPVRESFYIIGGYDSSPDENTTVYNPDIYRFNPETYDLTVVSSPGYTLYNAVIAFTGTQAIIAGGENGGGYWGTIWGFSGINETLRPLSIVSRPGGSEQLAIPSAVTEAAAAFINGTMYIYGGYAWGSQTNLIQKYNPVAKQSVSGWENLPYTVQGAMAVTIGKKGYLIGGYRVSTGIVNTIYVHTPDQSTGFQYASTMDCFGSIVNAGAVYSGSVVYVAGGYSSSVGPLDDVYAYDPSTGASKKIFDSLYLAVEDSATVFHDGKVWLFGGNESGTPVNTVQYYDTLTDVSWYQNLGVPSTIAGAQAVVYKDRAYIFGGSTGTGYSAGVLEYDLVNMTYAAAIATLPHGICDYGLAWTGEKAYIVGGRYGNGLYSSEVWEFDPSTKLVTNLGSVLPFGIGEPAVYYDEDTGYLHILGGRLNSSPYFSPHIWIFDPSAGTMDVSTVRMPNSIHGAAAVQGDGFMCLVGGYYGTTVELDTVLIYRNMERPWDGVSCMTDAQVTNGLAHAATAWYPPYRTNFVFGGLNAVGTSNKIGLVYPTTGLLVDTGVTLPYRISGASAVYLDGYIYVIGGYTPDLASPNNYLATVYRYDPSTGGVVDTGLDLPRGLRYTSACTDGTSIYIYGGEDSNLSLSNEVMVWDPVQGVNGRVYSDISVFPVKLAVTLYRNGYVYGFGGTGGSVISNVIWKFDTQACQFTLVGEMPLGVYGAAGLEQNGYMYIVGGAMKNRASDRIMTFDPSTGEMTLKNFRLSRPVYAPVGGGYSPFISGGYDVVGRIYRTTQRVDLTVINKEWTNGTVHPGVLSQAVAFATAEYDGKHIYLFGGEVTLGSAYSDEIIRLDPSANYDTATVATMGWSARDVATCYNPADGMIYYMGGYGSQVVPTYQNLASVFDPGTVSTANLPNMPEARAGHAILIADGHLLVIGGKTGSSVFGTTVLVYDLSTQTWNNPGPYFLNYSGQPYKNAYFGSAFDGSALYIFGGEKDSGLTDEIMRYDPYSNNLTLMNSRLPVPMRDCTATYDPGNDIFYVVGGDSGVYQDTIYTYNPNTDVLRKLDVALPEGMAGCAAAYDALSVIGGVSSSGPVDSVFEVVYIPNAPRGTDFDTGLTSGDVSITASLPHVYSYDLVEVSSGSSVLNWQLEPGQEYYFDLNVGIGTSFSDIASVDIYAWFDNGSDDPSISFYNSTAGKNINFHFWYVNSTTSAWGKKWPSGSKDIQGFNVVETALNATNHRLQFYFTPSVFTRWADGCTGGTQAKDGDNETLAWNDLKSWNFKIRVVDIFGNKVYAYDEFGVFKHQEIIIGAGNPYINAAPGSGLTQMHTSDAGDVSYLWTRINCPYRLNVNVSYLTGPETLDGSIMAVNSVDLGAVTYFPGSGYQNRLYVRGDAATWVTLTEVPGGDYDGTALTWYIDVPGGIAEGSYAGYITYRMETASEPTGVAAPNYPPDMPTDPTPADGATGIPSGFVTLQVFLDDDNGDLLDVTWYDASDDSVIGTKTAQTPGLFCSMAWNVPAGSTISWYVIVSDGQESMRSPTWTFTTANV